MSERHSSAASFGRMVSHVAGSLPAQVRPPGNHSAEAKRRERAGIRSPAWKQSRNGLPWKPYVYRGTGRDIYAEADDEC